MENMDQKILYQRIKFINVNNIHSIKIVFE